MINGLKDTGDHNILTKNDNYYLKTDQLAERITDGALTDRERVDSIFSWIVNHVDYDREAYQNSMSSSEDPQEVIYSKKAVCTGFSNLFAALCALNDVDARVVTGYARGAGYRDSTTFNAPNHAWNIVKIDGRWFLVDVSWTSVYRRHLTGGDAEMPGNSLPLSTYDDFYLADPASFVLTHLPEDPVWQLLDHPVSLNAFEKGKNFVQKELRESSREESFDFEKEIVRTEQLDSLERTICTLERSIENPRNQYREYNLGIAYYYKARRLVKTAQKLSSFARQTNLREARSVFERSLIMFSALRADAPDYQFAMLLADNIKMRIRSGQGRVVF